MLDKLFCSSLLANVCACGVHHVVTLSCSGIKPSGWMHVHVVRAVQSHAHHECEKCMTPAVSVELESESVGPSTSWVHPSPNPPGVTTATLRSQPLGTIPPSPPPKIPSSILDPTAYQ
eukprot:5473107-Amphidinium_carterae.1